MYELKIMKQIGHFCTVQPVLSKHLFADTCTSDFVVEVGHAQRALHNTLLAPGAVVRLFGRLVIILTISFVQFRLSVRVNFSLAVLALLKHVLPRPSAHPFAATEARVLTKHALAFVALERGQIIHTHTVSTTQQVVVVVVTVVNQSIEGDPVPCLRVTIALNAPELLGL